MSASLPPAARKAFATAVVATVLLGGLAVAAFLVGLRGVQAEARRATTVAAGTVREVDVGDAGDIRVGWRDDHEHPHLQRFGAYGDYRVGETVLVRYDPTHPDRRAFLADEDETDYQDGYYAGVVGTVGFAALFLVGLGLRWWWWRRAAARPRTPVLATPLSGTFNGATSTWLRLEDDGHRSWQMVMWEPSLSGFTGEFQVLAHGDPRGGKRVAPELPDGTVLVCQGRLRHKEPGRYLFSPLPSGGGSLAEVLVLPAGAVLPAPRPAWRTAATWAGGGAVVGAVMAVFVAARTLPVAAAFAAAFAAGAVNLWVLNGAED